MKLRLTLLMFSFIMCWGLTAQDFTLTVNSPASVAGDYGLVVAAFGPGFCEAADFNGELELVVDEGGGTEACGSVTNDLTGKIAVLDRGTCNFSIKCFNAQQQGAIAVIVCNNNDDPIFSMGPGENSDMVTIPCFMLSRAECASIRMEIPTVDVSVTKRVIEDTSGDVAVYEEQFDGGLNGWTSVGISDAADNWTWEADAASNGALIQRRVDAPSLCNGAAIFDFDFLETGGDQDNLPDPPLPRREAELISPVIDLSAIGAVELKFYQHNIPLNGQNTVEFSIDGGDTWSDPINVTTDNIFNADETNLVGTEVVRIPLPQLAGQSEARIKFVAEGDFYFWLIDDVKLVELAGSNAAISTAFYTPLSFGVPVAHADADPFLFQATISNRGGTQLTNVTVTIEVRNEDNGTVVHQDAGVISVVDIGTDTAFNINGDDENDLWLPTGLDPALYSMNFSVALDGIDDTDPSNNTFSHFFRITEDLFTKENDQITGANRVSTDSPWSWGAVYAISPNLNQDDIEVDKLTFSVASNEATMSGNYVRLYLAPIDDKTIEEDGVDGAFSYPFGGTFDRNDPDIPSHAAFDPAVVDEIFPLTDEANFDLVDVDIDEGTTLEPGRFYALFAIFDGQQVGGAPTANQNLFLSTSTQVEGSGLYIIDDNQDGTKWFTGYIGGTPAPVLRMTMKLGTSADDTPLPENAFALSPNPASDHVRLKVDLEEPTDGTFILARLDGQIIRMFDRQRLTQHEETLDISELSSGAYIIRLSTKEGTKTHKFVVQR